MWLPVQRLTSATLAAVLKRQPVSPGKLRLAWRVAAGASADRATKSLRVQRDTLVAGMADEHWRRALTRVLPLLRARLTSLLGPDLGSNIVVRTEPGAFDLESGTPRRRRRPRTATSAARRAKG